MEAEESHGLLAELIPLARTGKRLWNKCLEDKASTQRELCATYTCIRTEASAYMQQCEHSCASFVLSTSNVANSRRVSGSSVTVPLWAMSCPDRDEEPVASF